MRRFCLGVHACDIPVLELDTDPAAVKTITEACRTALETDDSDAIVFGCAGMSALCTEIGAELGVPVVDGVQAAVLTVQSTQRHCRKSAAHRPGCSRRFALRTYTQRSSAHPYATLCSAHSHATLALRIPTQQSPLRIGTQSKAGRTPTAGYAALSESLTGVARTAGRRPRRGGG